MNLKKKLNGLLALFYPLFQGFLTYQVYAYLAVGALNTFLNIALFAIFFHSMSPDGYALGGVIIESYTISLILAFLLTVPTGYWLAKHFAFNSQSSSGKEDAYKLLRYFLVVSQGLISDYLLLKFLVEVLDVYPTVAKVVSTVVILTVNYLLQKFYTFKNVRSV